jgi:hypothetical protein
MGQRRLLVVLCFMLFVACRGTGASPTPSASAPQATDQPSPTSVASPTAKPTPTPTPTEAPQRTAPPRTGPPTATAERDGILVELWLPEDVARIGERTFAHVRVTNLGPLAIEYEGNPCSESLGARLDYTASAPAGRSWPGIAGAFKARFLQEGSYGVRSFVNVERIDQEQRDCDTVGMPAYLEPATSLERTVALDLVGSPGRPIFSGPATALGRFAYRPGENEGEDVVEAEAPIRIDGERTPEYWIVDFVDRALAEPRFAEWLDQRPADTWINTHSVAWPNEDGDYPPDPCYERATDGALDIGLFREVPGVFEAGSVSLDLPSGDVLGVRFETGGERVYCE